MYNNSDFLVISYLQRNSILLSILTVFISSFFIRFILSKAKKSPTLYSFAFIHILIIVWSLGLILEELSMLEERWLRWGSLYISYIGICFFGYAWLIFCGYFTKSRLVSKYIHTVFLSIPFFVFYLLLITNKNHQLFYIVSKGVTRQFGPAYWCLVLVSYAYVSAGFALLIRYALKSKGIVRIQTLIIFLSCIIMFALNIFRIIYKFSLETTPITVSISTSIIFSFASYKYRLFNIVPISIMTFIESMEQGILIIDLESTIVGYNKALCDIFPNKDLLQENEPVKPFIKYLLSISNIRREPEILNAFKQGNNTLVKGHLQISFPEKRCYDIKVQPVIGHAGKTEGKIISFNDTTALHIMNEELIQMNTELKVINEDLNTANEELLDHALSVEELSITRERNRILNEMHDSIGQTYTIILSLLSVCKSHIINNAKVEKALDDMFQITKEGLNEIRVSIYNQRNRDIEANNLSDTLEKLFQFYGKSGLVIQPIVEGISKSLNYQIRHAVYKICQEALTNSIKHGYANKVYVIIEYKKSSIRLFILDNGKGCINITKGMGLAGIEQRIYELNGTISFGSQEDESGFYIQIEIPI